MQYKYLLCLDSLTSCIQFDTIVTAVIRLFVTILGFLFCILQNYVIYKELVCNYRSSGSANTFLYIKKLLVFVKKIFILQSQNPKNSYALIYIFLFSPKYYLTKSRCNLDIVNQPILYID